MQRMSILKIRKGAGSYQIEAVAIRCGRDISVSFGGGRAYHIGAAALAIPRASLASPEKRSASASVLCVTGHKDDLLCREAALRICAALNAVVNVTVGLHLDCACAEDIQALTDNFYGAVDEVIQALTCETAAADMPPGESDC